MAKSGTIGIVNAGGNDYLVASTAYGTCPTAASTATKIATLQDSAVFTLLSGVTVHIKFTYANTASSPKLNVNSTGAKSITNGTGWAAGDIVSFTYDGTSWLADKTSVVNDSTLKLQKNTDTASTLFTANASSDSTLKYTTTSIGSASGWSAGSIPTLGTAISADDITSWTTNTPTSIDTSKFSGGSFTRGTFSGGSFSQGTDSFTAGTLSVSGGGDSAASASTLTLSFSGGSFTQGSDTFTAATHGNDSFTAASLSSGFYTAGSAASLSYTAKSIPNVTGVGTAPSLTVTNTTVVNDISKA